MKKLEYLFKEYKEAGVPEKLKESIILRVEKFERRIAILKASVSGVCSLAFFGALYSSIGMTISEMSTSGLYHYANLLITDFSDIGAFWRELLLSLVQSLPVFAVTITLLSLLAFIMSIRATVRFIPERAIV